MIKKARYLVSTGREVSILPANSEYRLHKVVSDLQAANGKSTATYGKRYVYLNVDLRKPIHWIIVVADVSMLIIGIDLIQAYNLLNLSGKRRFIDRNTNSSVFVTFPVVYYSQSH